jgi:hypothetical protein
LTTHSRDLTPNASDRQIPPKHSHALAALPSVPHNTSHGSAHYFTKRVLTTPFTLMGAL